MFGYSKLSIPVLGVLAISIACMYFPHTSVPHEDGNAANMSENTERQANPNTNTYNHGFEAWCMTLGLCPWCFSCPQHAISSQLDFQS